MYVITTVFFTAHVFSLMLSLSLSHLVEAMLHGSTGGLIASVIYLKRDIIKVSSGLWTEIIVLSRILTKMPPGAKFDKTVSINYFSSDS